MIRVMDRDGHEHRYEAGTAWLADERGTLSVRRIERPATEAQEVVVLAVFAPGGWIYAEHGNDQGQDKGKRAETDFDLNARPKVPDGLEGLTIAGRGCGPASIQIPEASIAPTRIAMAEPSAVMLGAEARRVERALGERGSYEN